MNKEFNTDDMIINLKDLVTAVMLRWRSMIVVGLIAAVIAGAASYAISVYNIGDYNKKLQTSEEKNLSKLAENLEKMKNYTATDFEQLELKAHLIQSYSDVLDAYQFSGTQDIYTNLDANHVDSVVLQYAFDMKAGNDEITQLDLVSFENYLSSVICNSENLAKIAADLGNSTDAAMAKDLIEIEMVDSIENAKNLVDENNGEYYFFLNITCYGKDEAYCNTIADDIETFVAKASAEKNAGKTTHAYELVSREHFVTADKNIMEKKLAVTDRIKNQNDNLQKLITALSDEELAYVESYNKINYADKYKDSSEVPEKFISKKFIALGLVGGAFLMAAIYAFIYIIGGAVNAADDLTEMFGIKAYSLAVPEKKNAIDKWINSMRFSGTHFFDNDTMADIVVTEAGLKDVKKVVVTSSIGNVLDAEVVNCIIDKLKSAGAEAVSLKDIVYNPVSMKKLSEADGVVLIEERGKSKLKEVIEELKISSENNVKVLGCVVK